MEIAILKQNIQSFGFNEEINWNYTFLVLIKALIIEYFNKNIETITGEALELKRKNSKKIIFTLSMRTIETTMPFSRNSELKTL
jgi:hypothetical protein